MLLLNGSFVQTAAAVRYASDDPLYVTVLPLEAAYLPYTVEILNGKAVTNVSLTVCCDMGGGHRYIELKPRSAYVYSPASMRASEPSSTPGQLLGYVRAGNFTAARSLMSDELAESVSDEALGEFFEDVPSVRENIYTPEKGWLLIKKDGTAQRCDIIVHGGLIENIVI